MVTTGALRIKPAQKHDNCHGAHREVVVADWRILVGNLLITICEPCINTIYWKTKVRARQPVAGDYNTPPPFIHKDPIGDEYA